MVRHVLIVGGGIAGLALARTLEPGSFALDIVEREAAWRPAGAGLYLPGNAVRALHALGLSRRVAAQAVAIPTQRFSDHRGRVLREIDVTRVWADVGGCLAIARADLHDALRRSLRHVPIRMGVAVESLNQTDGVVAVEFSDGSSGDYDLVVAADGIASHVRHLTFGATATSRPVGQTGWRFLARRSREVSTWSVMLGRDAALLLVPTSPDRMYCYCDVLSATSSDSLDQVVSRFAVPDEVVGARVSDVHAATIEEVVLDRWSSGHVVVVGDAAHATSPNMAQGAAMALEDALVLAACLRGGRPIATALAAFEARRRPRTEWVRAQTQRRDHLRYLPAPARNALMRSLGQQLYRHSYRPLFSPP